MRGGRMNKPILMKDLFSLAVSLLGITGSIVLSSGCGGGGGGGGSIGGIANTIGSNMISYCSDGNGYPIVDQKMAEKCCAQPNLTTPLANAPEECTTTSLDESLADVNFEIDFNVDYANAEIKDAQNNIDEDPEAPAFEGPDTTSLVQQSAATSQETFDDFGTEPVIEFSPPPANFPQNPSSGSDLSNNSNGFSQNSNPNSGTRQGFNWGNVPSSSEPGSSASGRNHSNPIQLASTQNSLYSSEESGGRHGIGVSPSQERVRFSERDPSSMDFQNKDVNSMKGNDPEDYFSKIDRFSNLFKVVENRYQWKARRWDIYDRKKALKKSNQLAQ